MKTTARNSHSPDNEIYPDKSMPLTHSSLIRKVPYLNPFPKQKSVARYNIPACQTPLIALQCQFPIAPTSPRRTSSRRRTASPAPPSPPAISLRNRLPDQINTSWPGAANDVDLFCQIHYKVAPKLSLPCQFNCAGSRVGLGGR